ncbi:MAG: putative sulfate exporter family transporter [Cyanobacteria bacterium P01_D01_bin.156]
MVPPSLNENISNRNPLGRLLGSARYLNKLHGIFFVSLFSLAAYHLSSFEILKSLKMSPVIVGLILGAFYANSFGRDLPSKWVPGIVFCKNKILKIAIIFYGVKLTFQDLSAVGLAGLLSCFFIVISTFFIAFLLGKYCFKLDHDLSILIAAGSSICGSAAILATSSILKSKSYKNIIAVAITFLLGTLGMLLFPLVYRLGWFQVNETIFGVFLGITLPSVGNVAAAGAAVSEVTVQSAIIVKMIRVMMLVPFLLLLGLYRSRGDASDSGDASIRGKGSSVSLPESHTGVQYRPRNYMGVISGTPTIQQKSKAIVPWFAIFFIGAIAINSLLQPPLGVVNFINHVDKFCLTMAMTALGIETSAHKIQGVGLNLIYLGLVVSAWLIVAGLLITYFI